MTWLILGAALLIGVILVARWLVSADPKVIIRILKWTGLALAILFGVLLLVTGRLAWLWVAFVGLLPWVSRLRMLGRLSKAARGPSRGRHSEVKTRYVAMTLHHDSGDMDGEVLEGEFVGRRLSGLTQEEIVMIWREARRDDQSVKVLEAYLDRTYGESWGDSGTADGSRQTAPGGPMSLEEAYKILGLGPGASEQEIGQRHRDLMKKMHPDHGGSDYLASRINEAKDTLLSQK
ncbi:MAG: DnaJ domain-containing protein [Alphaproteobacteria bacterium]